MDEQNELPSRAERLREAERLVQAIKTGDDEAEHAIVQAIGRRTSARFYTELDRISRELRETLCNVRRTDELSRLAQRELPDAQLRLNQVLELTEEAAHNTLNAVEESLPTVDRLGDEARSLLHRWPKGRSMRWQFKQEISALLTSLAADAALLKQKYSDVLIAQGFQDITGQIMRPVLRLVAELEAHLSSSEPAGEFAAVETAGPVLAGQESPATVAGQQDVDDLLSQFGV